MRVVLESKVILADRLTMDQASSLIRQIRERLQKIMGWNPKR